MSNPDAIEFTKEELQQLNYLLFKVRAKYPEIEDIRCDGKKIWGYSFEIYNGVVKTYDEEHPTGDEGCQIY